METSETRSTAARILIRHAEEFLDPKPASEFARYATLSTEVSAVRERLKIEMDELRRALPRLSMGQLLHVAERTFRRLVERAASGFPGHDSEESVAENERRLHALSGYANDAIFAVIRALNETAGAGGDRNLRRPDVVKKSLEPFSRVAMLAGLLNSLDHILDSASF